MKLKHPLDAEISKRMENFSPSVPDHIWENIAAKKDKRRPFVFFFWNKYGGALLFSALLLLTGGLLFRFFAADHEAKAHPMEMVSSHNNTLEADNAASQYQHTSRTDIQDAATGTNGTNGINNTKSDRLVSANSNRQIQSSNTSADKQAILNEQANSGVTGNNLKYHRKNQSGVVSFSQGPKSAVSQHSTVHLLQSDLFSSNNQTIPQSKSLVSDMTDAVLTHRVDEYDVITLQKTFHPSIQTISLPSLNIPCPVNKPSGQKTYLDVYASPDYVLRQFKDTPHSTYLISRKASTKFASAFSAGLRITKVFTNGLSLSAGLNFSQINEKFSYSQGNIINEQYIINNNGDTIGSYQTSSTLYKTTYNRYRTFDIPLTVGYEKSGEKWNLGFSTGLVVNIHSWNKGEVLNAALQPVDIGNKDNSNPYAFKSNIGIGGMAAVNLCYKWHERTGLFAEPCFRYNFSSMNSNDISLKQKYHTSGIRFGIRMKL